MPPHCLGEQNKHFPDDYKVADTTKLILKSFWTVNSYIQTRAPWNHDVCYKISASIATCQPIQSGCGAWGSQGRVKVSHLGDCFALQGLLCWLGLLALAQAINRTLGWSGIQLMEMD